MIRYFGRTPQAQPTDSPAKKEMGRIGAIFCLISLNLSCVWSMSEAVPAESLKSRKKSQFTHFVSRVRDQLRVGDKQLRFLGLHATELHRIENDAAGPNSFRWPTPAEQENWIRALVGSGHTVTRIYTLSVRRAKDPKDLPVHVEGPGRFNEEGFLAFDKMLELCNKYGLRVIVPFVDNWDWWGGIADYTAFRGKPAAAFHADPQVRQDFKNTISYVLNRVNRFTGVPYKEDKAIAAWETGNELRQTTREWLRDIAAYIKQIDPNHLVMDGTQTVEGAPLTDFGLSDPNVDIISNHYYANDLTPAAIARDVEQTRGRKPFFAGEFGIPPLGKAKDVLGAFMDKLIDSPTVGGLVWGFRGHRREGGFYYHKEGDSGIFSYHLPGFPENDSYEELTVVNLIRSKQAKINNQAAMLPLWPPETPKMLPGGNPHRISWFGSSTGRHYDLVRGESPKGPWMLIAKNLSDGANQFDFTKGLYHDATAKKGAVYYYAVRARNESGESPYSAPEKYRIP